jgi:hypothetical protein
MLPCFRFLSDFLRRGNKFVPGCIYVYNATGRPTFRSDFSKRSERRGPKTREKIRADVRIVHVGPRMRPRSRQRRIREFTERTRNTMTGRLNCASSNVEISRTFIIWQQSQDYLENLKKKPWEGPYEITARKSERNYEILNRNRKQVVHANRPKPAYGYLAQDTMRTTRRRKQQRMYFEIREG